MTVIAIPYVPMPTDQNPNVKSGRSDTYMISSYVTLSSLRRWNPFLDLRFVSDRTPSAEWLEKFESINVASQVLPFEHLPPKGFANKFLGSLYLLDVLGKIEADYLCVIDPDVFCIRSLDGALRDVSKVRVLNIPSPRDLRINGLAPLEADVIHGALGEPRVVDYHYGGEFYGIPSGARSRLLTRIEKAWEHSLDAWSRGQPYFTTEEHVLNFALAESDVQDAQSFIRRIWTAHSYRTVVGDEQSLALWHLPSEKERGFRRLFEPASDRESWFWQASSTEFIQRAGTAFGLHDRDVLRLGLDIAGRVKRTLQRGRLL